MVWYEWYREVPPGSSYSGIEKTVDLPAPEGANHAIIYEISNSLDENDRSITQDATLEPVATSAVSEAGTVSVVLRDQIVLMEFSAEPLAAVPDVTESSDIASSDAASSTEIAKEKDLEKRGGDTSGCQSARTSTTGSISFMLLALCALYFRRRFLHLPARR